MYCDYSDNMFNFCVVTPAPIDYFALFEYDYYDHKQKIAKEKYYYETFRGQ